MVEQSDGPALMVLCSVCGSPVAIDASCLTCGEPDPRGVGGSAGRDALDEGLLLERVGTALTAQAALARRVAAERVRTAARLFEESVAIQARLRRQRMLLDAHLSERGDILAEAREALGRIEAALDEAAPPGKRGDDWVVGAQLPRDRTCATVARRLLEEYVREGLPEQSGEDVLLIVSELVTNAFLHGEGTIVLRVGRRSDRIRIEVSDEGHGGGISVVSESERGDHGHGLWVIEQLASAWGSERGTGHVWAELTLDR